MTAVAPCGLSALIGIPSQVVRSGHMAGAGTVSHQDLLFRTASGRQNSIESGTYERSGQTGVHLRHPSVEDERRCSATAAAGPVRYCPRC